MSMYMCNILMTAKHDIAVCICSFHVKLIVKLIVLYINMTTECQYRKWLRSDDEAHIKNNKKCFPHSWIRGESSRGLSGSNEWPPDLQSGALPTELNPLATETKVDVDLPNLRIYIHMTYRLKWCCEPGCRLASK